MLQCIKCELILDFNKFHKSSSSKSGYRGECKDCRKLSDLSNYEKNKSRILEKRKEYYIKTKDVPEIKAKRKAVKSKHYEENYEFYILGRCKKRAKQSNLDIELEDIIIPDICPVLNVPLVRGKKKASINSPSVDRIDPNRGYTKDNIQIISNLANMMKNNASPEQLIKFAEWVLRTYKTVL
jgi:hypothetical protein